MNDRNYPHAHPARETELSDAAVYPLTNQRYPEYQAGRCLETKGERLLVFAGGGAHKFCLLPVTTQKKEAAVFRERSSTITNKRCKTERQNVEI